MINRNLHSRSAIESDMPSDSGNGDLSTPPEAYLPPSPEENSLAMLGEPSPESQGGVLPSEAGPTGQILGAMGMVVQGSQILAMHLPGFVPMEVTAWMQQAMQVLPQMLQQQQSGMGAAGSGALPVSGMLGPGGQGGGMPPGQSGAPMSASPAPQGPPRPSY